MLVGPGATFSDLAGQYRDRERRRGQACQPEGSLQRSTGQLAGSSRQGSNAHSYVARFGHYGLCLQALASPAQHSCLVDILAELGFAVDGRALGEIAQLQCASLADAEPGRGHQIERAMSGQRCDGARRRQAECRLQEPPDVPDRDRTRLRSQVEQATEGIAVRHLVA